MGTPTTPSKVHTGDAYKAEYGKLTDEDFIDVYKVNTYIPSPSNVLLSFLTKRRS
jgi:hypothetical protein